MTLKLLVFGHSGQVASALRQCSNGQIQIRTLSRAEADLKDAENCARIVAETDADAVLNAAAYTAVDGAETNERLAMRVNADAPGAMASAASRKGVPFIHLSTDYVFDGTGDRPWTETDRTRPLNAYGRSKRAGELAVLRAGGSSVILRTSWIFAAEGQNFLNTMLGLATSNQSLSVVADQWGGPTASSDIATALLRIARGLCTGDGSPGLFHYAGGPFTTWHGFAQEIFLNAGLAVDAKPISTSDWPTPALRPLNAKLDCERICHAYGLEQPDWRSSLSNILGAREKAAA